MTLRRTRRPLSDTVKDRLARAIKSGAYAEDERLPPEHDLAAEFGVSRPIVRNALQGLRDMGLIESRRGAGSFVRNAGVREPIGFGPLESLEGLAQCYEFRLTIEPRAASAAAERCYADDLSEINAALADMRAATDRQRHREEADFAFHSAIANASGNSYFATTFAALKDHISAGMQMHGRSVLEEFGGLDRVLAEHQAIYEAIRDSDPGRAESQMRAHLLESRARTIGGMIDI